MTKLSSRHSWKPQLEDFSLEVLPGNPAVLGAFLQKKTAFWHQRILTRRLSAE